MATIQNALNQNALFQQTFAARQGMGQIFATSPDTDTAFARIMQSPFAPFAMEQANQWNQMQSAMTQRKRVEQEIGQSGRETYLKLMIGAYNNPGMLPHLSESAKATLPDSEGGRMASQAIDSINHSLVDGLDINALNKGDPKATAEFHSRIAGLATASGTTPESIRGLSGVPAPQWVSGVGPQGQPVSGFAGGPVYGTGMAGLGSTASGSGLSAGLMGPTTSTEETMKSTARQMGDVSQRMYETGAALPSALNRINEMQQAIGERGFQAGGGAEMRGRLGQVMQGLKNAGVGISQDMIDTVANKSLSSTQVFQAFSRPEVISQLKEAAQGTGRVMRSEVDAFLALLNPNVDPETIRQMLNTAKYDAATKYDQMQKFTEFRKAGGTDPQQFIADYSRNLDTYGLPTRAPGGLDFSPIPASQVKGAAPGGETWRGWGEQGQISQGAVRRLRANPSEAPLFEQHFGLPPGGAQQYLPRGR
jgi:uncharacterized protein YidB (DUF937 family)